MPQWVSPTRTQLDNAYEVDGSTIMGADSDERGESICMIALRVALVMTVFVFDSRFTGVPRASTCSPRPFRPNLSGLMGNTVDDLCLAIAKLATQIEHASGITIGSILRADTFMDVNEYKGPKGSWGSLNDLATAYPGPVQRAVLDAVSNSHFTTSAKHHNTHRRSRGTSSPPRASRRRTSSSSCPSAAWPSATSTRWSPPSTRSSPESRARVVSPRSIPCVMTYEFRNLH